MLARVKSLWRDEEGQGMVEYGLIIALVAVAVIGALFALGGGIQGIFGEATEQLGDAPDPDE